MDFKKHIFILKKHSRKNSSVGKKLNHWILKNEDNEP